MGILLKISLLSTEFNILGLVKGESKKNINSSITGNIVDFEYNKRNYAFTTNIIGSFQTVNLLMAAKMTANLGG